MCASVAVLEASKAFFSASHLRPLYLPKLPHCIAGEEQQQSPKAVKKSVMGAGDADKLPHQDLRTQAKQGR